MRTPALSLLLALALTADGVAGDAPRAIADLENDLVADDPAVRAKAAAELTDRFPDGAVAVPMLVDLLDDEDAAVVAAAAKAIDSMAVAGAGPLAAWCADKSRMGPTSPFAEFVTDAGSSRWFDVLDSRGDPPDPSCYVAAALRRRADEPFARETMSRLTSLVQRLPADSRPLPATALAWIGADRNGWKGIASTDNRARAKAVVAAEGLLKTDGDLRSWAGARMLRCLRPDDAGSIATMTNALFPPERVPRFAEPDAQRSGDRNDSLMEALGRAGPKAASAAPRLVAFLGVPDVRSAAVDALIDIGEEDEIVAALARKVPDAGTIAEVLARRRRAPDAALPVLLDRAKIDSTGARCIAEFGPSGAAALPRLREMLATSKATAPLFAVEYANAILAVAPGDAEAAAFLRSVLDSPDVGGRAHRALLMHGPIDARGLRALSGRLEFDRSPTRLFFTDAALGTVARRGPPAIELTGAIVRLANAVNDDRAKTTGAPPAFIDLRHSIAVALGRVGADDAESTAILLAWRDKGDAMVRVAAAQALRRLRAKK